MEYKGYKIEQKDNKVIVEKVEDFNPVHVFDCGQCFRWIRQPDGSYTGVACGRALNVKYRDGVLELSNTGIEDFKSIWFDYFDLGRDYSHIKEKVMKDEIMREAVKFGSGIRLLKQNIWETLISFIISANNRIPRIMKTVDEISRLYGCEIEMDGEKYYAFPSAKQLSHATLEELEQTGAGFRCKYIMNAAKMVNEGKINLEDVCSMDTVEARDFLMRFQGVGPKVADCTLLYSGTKYDVFPTDVWVKRVMEELYFKSEASFGEIQEFARDYFGKYAGFAQQYLFYYARENRIGAK
ncbi:MAG TPA: DNA-3-methyladenine glycosylase 2 [Hungateiclostridium thermocellum]|uniref:DNA-(apurinic or apyrimidinic site) lyase n=1 Tax=Acetivibrio thermocellus (strain ATCC 27405 / DSM 1237 / JCM 9322 / NBRC 103400 / NCIMB 10682 / NRRL B-4536 / VPI 7372) TaxID=203119 RepID=A3DH46_ACET2|nr:DNA glycosylase [Acetivibrio thermocellus]CDG36569.1 8-oxoguanine DNA glycosylase-like protein [Acetivibrio thermocellus BC1]ABN53275.1 DNA-(apurinic or apyrimidinic site) lyase [Acetivibrio thermocellus ATCC 27405]NLU27610.1 DNA glycosylase [Acetivibrio thermocellus]THJ77088.1 DNA-3-methyladenine glycosylase 2 [Acetivibrio thermocellus]UWV46643.1 DNA glycosylase [Acetivibrio thermocellus]